MKQHKTKIFQRNQRYNNNNANFEICLAHLGDGVQGLSLSLSSHSGSRSSSPADTISRITSCFPTSKFLRAAQELLVEVCRMCQGISSPQVPLISYHAQYITQSPVDAARKENRETLLLKKDDLMMILNEVEARHKRYREHFRVMMNNFNVHAGAETATPYLDLAFQTMSCQFRAVRDATNKQLRMVRRALGEEHVFRAGSGETSRHYQIPHDQWNCQQQAVQVMGTPHQHHSWRPQRGLPERAVTILRDWMTKNFLHPYPNDADKLLLAKQTCLTRSQVSNWFINARVRLWKPMVEELYMEEQRIAAQEVNARRQLAETSGVPSKSLELFRRKLY
ncbi:unnamed protein product [Sphagnum jensenii]|uniref:Homeobox domain-containing protein n=1 Tax=Sphagnum jensenii TaxID=128206 RepID=A0ABP0V9M9_9BRYO